MITSRSNNELHWEQKETKMNITIRIYSHDENEARIAIRYGTNISIRTVTNVQEEKRRLESLGHIVTIVKRDFGGWVKLYD